MSEWKPDQPLDYLAQAGYVAAKIKAGQFFQESSRSPNLLFWYTFCPFRGACTKAFGRSSEHAASAMWVWATSQPQLMRNSCATVGMCRAGYCTFLGYNRAIVLLRRRREPMPDDPIKHVIVLMLENRSFDHMLGSLA